MTTFQQGQRGFYIMPPHLLPYSIHFRGVLYVTLSILHSRAIQVYFTCIVMLGQGRLLISSLVLVFVILGPDVLALETVTGNSVPPGNTTNEPPPDPQ